MLSFFIIFFHIFYHVGNIWKISARDRKWDDSTATAASIRELFCIQSNFIQSVFYFRRVVSNEWALLWWSGYHHLRDLQGINSLNKIDVTNSDARILLWVNENLISDLIKIIRNCEFVACWIASFVQQGNDLEPSESFATNHRNMLKRIRS